MDIKFGSASYFWLILLVPALIVFFIYAFRQKAKALSIFANSEVLKNIVLSVSLTRQKVKITLFIIAVLFIVLALTRPKWGFHWQTLERKGVDIILAIDVSKSMLADDIKPNRLERAKREVKDLIKHLEDAGSDRVGLIVFAGSSFVQCPLTLDYNTLALFLDDINPNQISYGGTAIGDAIYKCMETFEGKIKQYKTIILITDGEDHESNPESAAEEAKKQGVVIHTIGIGRREGSLIPITEESGQQTFLKDKEGNAVRSRIDEDTLRKIALKTGGRYIPATSGNFQLVELYDKVISQMEQRQLQETKQKKYEERYQWFLLIGVMLFALENLISDRKKSLLALESGI